MNYVLDTGILIEISKDNKSLIDQLDKLLRSTTAEPSITLFNFAEFYAGEIGRRRESEALKFLSSFNQLTLSQASAKTYAELWHRYSRKGTPVAVFDLLIASIAIVSNATLLTLDKDFGKVDELKKIIFAA